jgi:bifunctional ADP-heptose synthase (sugar kinase/adenylyltransferase)
MINSAETLEKHYEILVVGDFMIDRSWIVGSAGASTSQAHDNVLPQQRLELEKSDIRPGGAGLTVCAIQRTMKGNSCAITLLASWSKADSRVERMFPNCNEDMPRINLVRLPPKDESAVVTTEKFRIYQKTSSAPLKLQARYDQDAKVNTQWDLQPDIRLPSKPCAVVITDFAKGVICEELWKFLLEKYQSHSGLKWFIDSKLATLGTSWFRLPEGDVTIFPNRDEFVRWRNELLKNQEEDPINPKALRVRADIVKQVVARDAPLMIRKLSGKHSNVTLCIKLDSDGAILVEENEDQPNSAKLVSRSCHRSTSHLDIVGAGDVFLAGWVAGALTQNAVGASQARGYLESASDWAASWAALEMESRIAGVSLPAPENMREPMEVYKGEFEPKEDFSTPEQWTESYKKRRITDIAELQNISSINTSELCGFVGDYMVTDINAGLQIKAMLEEMRERIKYPMSVSRPFNCLITAKSGTGKSFLAKEIAKELGTAFHELNASRLPTGHGMNRELAEVAQRFNRDVPLVLLLDEIDATPGSEPLFPLLLSPLWDGSIWHEGQLFQLPRVLMTVLVASSGQHDNWLDSISGHPKGPEFKSRLNGRNLRLATPTDSMEIKAYRVYLFCALALRYFPETVAIDKRILKAIVGLHEVSARKLEYIVASLRPNRNGIIAAKDISTPCKELGLLERFGIGDNKQFEENLNESYQGDIEISRHENQRNSEQQ